MEETKVWYVQCTGCKNDFFGDVEFSDTFVYNDLIFINQEKAHELLKIANERVELEEKWYDKIECEVCNFYLVL